MCFLVLWAIRLIEYVCFFVFWGIRLVFFCVLGDLSYRIRGLFLCSGLICALFTWVQYSRPFFASCACYIIFGIDAGMILFFTFSISLSAEIWWQFLVTSFWFFRSTGFWSPDSEASTHPLTRASSLHSLFLHNLSHIIFCCITSLDIYFCCIIWPTSALLHTLNMHRVKSLPL